MTAEHYATATFDRRHDLELTQAQVTGLSTTPRRPVDAEDIGDL